MDDQKPKKKKRTDRAGCHRAHAIKPAKAPKKTL